MNFLLNINVCRVCMQNENCCDLWTDKDLLDKFIFTTRLAISEKDNLPKVICANCCVRLKVAHKFINQALESEKNLKKFLTKVSNEFQEVTQGNKTNKKTLNEKNLAEDDILSLSDDEDPENIINDKVVKTKVQNDKSVNAVNNENLSKSPILEKPKKKCYTDKDNDVNPASEDSPRSSKSDKTVYHINEELLLKHADKIEIELDKSTSYMEVETELLDSEQEPDFEEDENNVEMEEEQLMVEEQEQEEDEEQEEEQDMEEEQERVEVHAFEHETEQADALDPADEQEQEEKNEQEKEINLTDGDTYTNDIGLNEESETQSLLTELVFKKTPKEICDEENDGYLHEYETMLQNQEINLQDEQHYINENSVEEIKINPDTSYLVDDDDDDKQDDSIKINEKSTTVESKPVTKQGIYMRRFYCEQCDRDFSTKTNLNRHVQAHGGTKAHACTQCDKSFTQKSTLKQHMYSHTGEKPHVCPDCNRGFTQSKSLIFHMRRHTGEKPYFCEYCLVSFRQKDALRVHIMKHHAIIEQISDGVEIYTCIICKKQYDTKNKFKTHLKAHTAYGETSVEFLKRDQVGLTKGKKTIKNNLSIPIVSLVTDANSAGETVFPSSAAVPSRAKKFKCRICFKCFALKKSLIRHMRVHDFDTDDNVAECAVCNIQFSCQEELHLHLVDHHNYACSNCPDLVFKTIQDLKMHMFEHELDQEEDEDEEQE